MDLRHRQEAVIGERRTLTPVPMQRVRGLRSTRNLLLLAATLLPLMAIDAHAQGCAQCLDSTRATPPAVQAAYRHAILMLVTAASTLFVVGLILFRRNP